MKSSNGTGFLILFFLAIFVILSSSSSTSAARHLPNQQPGGEDKVLLKADGVIDTQLKEDLRNLMGAEEESQDQKCDDECVKRRMIAEAHLDYIYTQNHKP